MKSDNQNASRTSIILTILVQVVVGISLYLVTAWKAPEPPIPIYGIELSIFDNSPEVSSTEEEVDEAGSDSELPVDELTAEEQLEQIEPTNDVSDQTIEPETTKSVPNEVTQDPATELQEEVVESKLQQEEQEVTKPVNLVGGDSTGIDDSKDLLTSEIEKSTTNKEHSESTEEVKSTDSEEVIIDNRSLFTAQEGQQKQEDSGLVIDIAGFSLTEAPRINDTSSESGSITFDIEVSEDGYISKIQVKQATVSPVVVAIYRDAVYELYFERTSANVPPATAGTITFIIKSK